MRVHVGTTYSAVLDWNWLYVNLYMLMWKSLCLTRQVTGRKSNPPGVMQMLLILLHALCCFTESLVLGVNLWAPGPPLNDPGQWLKLLKSFFSGSSSQSVSKITADVSTHLCNYKRAKNISKTPLRSHVCRISG